MSLIPPSDYVFFFGYVQLDKKDGSATFGDPHELAEVNGKMNRFHKFVSRFE